MGDYAAPAEVPDASDMTIALVAARYNDHLTGRLVDGARTRLAELGHDPEPAVHWVPGAFEIPVVAQRVARSGTVDAVICVAAVVRGDTPHFEYVAGPCADGCARVALDTGVPVIFGVLTTNDEQQALDRTGGSEGHKGCEAATTAVETVATLRRIPADPDAVRRGGGPSC